MKTEETTTTTITTTTTVTTTKIQYCIVLFGDRVLYSSLM